MHNKFVPFVTLNAVKGLKKIPHYIRNDKFFVQFSDLLNYRSEDTSSEGTVHLQALCTGLL